MDPSADPCVNFYQYACGGWMAKNPIPGDQSRWGRFDELQERNYDILHGILEKAAIPNPKRDAVMQKIGDNYAACMDETRVNALGAKPIQTELQRIEAIKSRQDVIKTVAYLHSIGVNSLFGFGPGPNMHDASQMIANVDQGGLGLPDRDYYLKADPKSVETRERYVAHVEKMFELLGDKPDSAEAEAKTVLQIETDLAKASMDRAERRNPAKRDHLMSVAELNTLAPNFEFTRYFADANAPKFDKLNVLNPEFFKQVNGTLDSVPIADWKTYLRWHLVRTTAPALSEPFIEEDFAFERKYMNGQKEIQARWKRCVIRTDHQLGEALGQPYVDETFGVEGKQRTLKMVNAIEKAMGEDIQDLAWMTDETKKQADVKLRAVNNHIGYPDKWRDYSKLTIKRDDALRNYLRANTFEENRQLNKIGKPVDRSEWSMSPPTVNAYYRPPMNDINFPAGILQPPFYDNNIDDAVNYGGIGAVIGHELTHGFDDQGSQYDALGNFHSWWTPADRAEFDKRTQCLADQYASYVAVDDVHLNGKLTLGENTADNGGVRISYLALQDAMTQKGGKPAEIDGFKPEQRFFLSYGQIWCQNVTPENSRLRAFTDPHSPGKYRVNGVVSNSAEFQKAFGCKAGQPMVRENACHVW
ncbi:MAG TPA: M13 family metallopeptidase [Terriglobales bacterium]|nr:M13 family metallopeptidase [Terriglobales bacterium]